MQKHTPKRIDAFLSSLGYCSRKEAKKFMRMYTIRVKNDVVFNPALKAYHEDITINNEPLDALTLTLLMHKPKDVICSHDDAGVLIYSLLPERWQRRNPKLSTVGRLDVDTTGAILITDNGALNHKLTSPKSEAIKVYEATLAQPLRGDEAEIFESGNLMLHGEIKHLLPAKLTVISPTRVQLEICEGRYHQVKRMFAAVGNRVIQLHRLNFAGFSVENIPEGEYKIIQNIL
ncbi:MAG: pseudouridine synthase [Candidatus Marinarcus sp.]|uniref:pseudouridine synthase n=1 Tax=Candidatus Marinarcus sp. TaxID=3100987 RepID=UPI003AFFD99E